MAKKNTTLMDLNKVYSEINLGDFFNKDYASYAVYRALQRIPNIMDGFAQTQRKVISTCLDKNIINKTKVSDLSSIVSLHTHYHHGSSSIESAITGLVPPFSNQLPLLREDGTYGSRSEREASAARYIETRMFKYSKMLFNDIDNTKFIEEQFTEGHKIEPVTLLPLLPLLLINGQDQIGVGYSCKILPRDINEIISILENILNGKKKSIPVNIKPMIPLFKGTIQDNGKGGWSIKGIIKEINKTTLRISEVPPKYTRETYINILEKLKDSNKIKDYHENILGDNFEIDIKVSNEHKLTGNNFDLSKLIKLFSLEQNITENITVINTEGIIKKYNTIAEVFYEYIVTTLSNIKKRKEYILVNLRRTMNINKEKIRFIEEFNNENIILKNKATSDIENELKLAGFKQYGKLVDDVETDISFNYLLKMNLDSLTDEKIKELKKEIENNIIAVETMENKTPAMIWLEDIQKIKAAIIKGD